MSTRDTKQTIGSGAFVPSVGPGYAAKVKLDDVSENCEQMCKNMTRLPMLEAGSRICQQAYVNIFLAFANY